MTEVEAHSPIRKLASWECITVAFRHRFQCDVIFPITSILSLLIPRKPEVASGDPRFRALNMGRRTSFQGTDQCIGDNGVALSLFYCAILNLFLGPQKGR